MRLLNLGSLLFFFFCLLSITWASSDSHNVPLLPPRLLGRGLQGPPSKLARGMKRDAVKPVISPRSSNDNYREHVFYAANTYCTNLAIGSKVGSDGTVLWKMGNGGTVQQVYIAHSATLGLVISYEGTNKTSFGSVSDDLTFHLTSPWSGLKWLGPDVKIGRGFQEAWDDSAQQILAELRRRRDQYPNAPIVTTGHSLGGAIAMLGALHISHNLNVPVKVVVFGMPRTGNRDFANTVDRLLPDQRHIIHHQDPVPHLPAKVFGFRHPSGEIWIANEKGNLVYECAGQENSLCADSVSVFNYEAIDHTGPYFGVSMNCVLNE